MDFSTGKWQNWLTDIQDHKRNLRICDRPLVLLGAGSVLAQDFVTHCLRQGKVLALVDNARRGQTDRGVPVLGDADIAALMQRVPDAIGVLCCGSEVALEHFQNLWGESHSLLSYFEVIHSWEDQSNAGHRLRFLASFSDQDTLFAQFDAARSAFQDEESRRVLDALILYRLTWDLRYISRVRRPEKDIYFDSEIMPLNTQEVFVDGGAFDGDTVRNFIKKTRGHYDHIHAFEIDPVNSEAFAAKTKDAPRVTLHRTGLWNEPAKIGLEHRPDDGSRINEDATQRVPLQAMDNLDLGSVSLIKLDVEGAEVQALEGGRSLIEKHRPKLAVCAYHKADDLAKLLKTLGEIRNDYRLYLRHYSPIIFDTVIYAL